MSTDDCQYSSILTFSRCGRDNVKYINIPNAMEPMALFVAVAIFFDRARWVCEAVSAARRRTIGRGLARKRQELSPTSRMQWTDGARSRGLLPRASDGC